MNCNLPYHERTPSGLNERLWKLEKRVVELESKDKFNPSPLYGQVNELKCVIADLKKENEELRAELQQATQTAINFHESWSSLKDENSELVGINQSLSVDWVKFQDMRQALERIVAWYENEEQGGYALSTASKALGI